MRLATPFDPIELGEIDNFAFDFTADMGAATMVSTAWTCALAPFQTATDPAPQSRILSVATQTTIQVRARIASPGNAPETSAVASPSVLPLPH
jgi:hypothetical protein